MLWKEQPLVSVIIPAFNAEKHIEVCIKSIQRQTYNNLQIIVVDDGSSDGTGKLCHAAAEKDSRIVVVRQKNQGVSAARNAGIELASGVYLCFVDADDKLPEHSIAILENAMREGAPDVVFGNHDYLYGDRILKRHDRILEKIYTVKEICPRLIDGGTLSGITFGSVCGAIYKTEFIHTHNIRFRKELTVNEDGIFNVEYCVKADQIRYLSHSVYHYRQWKEEYLPSIHALQAKLAAASSMLRDICNNNLALKETGEKQLQAREMFCVFQLSVLASRFPKQEAMNALHSIWDGAKVNDYKNILNYSAIGWGKKLLWYLIVKKKRRLFFLLLHDIYPLVCQRIKR